ncbi:hypothetical protein, partial [Asanoa sp. NPDC050611]|uniref:hypothetical protein n=1 Tax=Asanoa sp. NPDC050611 TaxID=3157098 RepID=UPI00340D66D4
DAFQEADIQGITLPITKHNFLGARRGAAARPMARLGRGVRALYRRNHAARVPVSCESGPPGS